MIDLDAELVPGVRAAGLTIGGPVGPIVEAAAPEAIEPRNGLRVLKYGAVWVFDRGGVVDQVCVWPGYRGRLAGSIGIGSGIAEVEAALGPVVEDEEDNLVVAGMGGWCFEVEWGHSPIGSPGRCDAPISWICITEADV